MSRIILKRDDARKGIFRAAFYSLFLLERGYVENKGLKWTVPPHLSGIPPDLSTVPPHLSGIPPDLSPNLMGCFGCRTLFQ
jgi:hypothetical protein